MAALDAISIGILLGALLVLAGIMSSLVALRFGAPLLLVFLIVGMLAGEGGPGGIQFDDVRTTYLVGSIALALILFDGGLRTRLATFRSVLAPAATLATVGVMITAGVTPPVARDLLHMSWSEALLGGGGVGPTPAAAGVLPGPCPRLAPAPPRRRYARGRIRQQRSVRGPAHRPSGRVSVGGRRVVGTRAGDAGRASRARHHHRYSRRASHRVRAQPARAGAGAARAVRDHERARHLRPRFGAACLGLSCRLSRRPG